MKRTPLRQRMLPDYTNGEEIMNMVTHIVGGAMGICVFVFCLLQANTITGIVSSCIYAGSMLLVYCMSSIYHGLRPGMAKKVLQVLDHCAIYFLIAGTYTPILLCAFVPVYPLIGWGLFAAQWGLLALAVTLTAIDLERYNTFSMICYIFMGWGIIFFTPQAIHVLGSAGFQLVLAGGITYTVGAILYGIGNKVRWMHSVFHIFVVAGSFLQFMAIYLYVL